LPKIKKILHISYMTFSCFIKHFKKITFSLIIAFFAFSFVPLPVSAQISEILPTSDMICGGPCPLIDGDFEFDQEGLFRFIISISTFLTFLGIGLSVIIIVWSGLKYIIGKDEDARKGIYSALIGLVIIILAYTAVNLVVQALQGNLVDIAAF